MSASFARGQVWGAGVERKKSRWADLAIEFVDYI
jgi:hypothetical protein